MDPKRLIAAMAERLYDDIKFVTQQNPVQIVDDDGARAYNALLARVRREFHYVDTIGDFTEWSPRTIKYKDALVVAGQLCAVIQVLTDRPAVAPRGVAAPTTMGVPTAAVPRPVSPALSAPTQPIGNPIRKPPGGPLASPLSQSTASVPIGQTQGPPSGASDTRVGGPPQPQPPQQQTPSDQELYGSNRAPRRNDDGTIPFSLD